MSGTVDTTIGDLKEKGYCVFPEVVDPAECDHVRLILETMHRKYATRYVGNKGKPHAHGSRRGDQIVYNVHNKDRAFLKFIDRSPVFEVVETALQEGSYQNAEQVILRQAGARSPVKGISPQQMHIDSRFPGCRFPLMLAVFWFLDDSTPETGATRVIPGSHRRSSYPEQGVVYPDEVQLTVKRGTAVILDGGLWHAGGENQTDNSRWTLVLPYVRWFVKPSFDFNRNMPRDLFDALTDRQKRVMGYHCNPPLDEFTRTSTGTEQPDIPAPYALPDD